MKRAGSRMTVDWPAGRPPPAVGDVFRYVSPSLKRSYKRVLTVRLVKHRKPLRDGYVSRYALTVEPVDQRPDDAPVWCCFAYARRKPHSSNGLDSDLWGPPGGR